MSKIKEIKCNIKGKVQGVFFRDFVKKSAEMLDIKGTAQNLNDGSVEVFAQGEEGDLKKFLDKLKTGSYLSQVDNIDIKSTEPEEVFKSFEIIYK